MHHGYQDCRRRRHPQRGQPRRPRALFPVELLGALDGWLTETGHDGGHPWRVSIAETLAAHEGGPAPGSITLSEDRQLVGLEAAWELDAIKDMLSDLCGDLGGTLQDQAELVQTRLKVRGVTVRMAQLASVLMSVLSDDDTTAALYKKVHGHDCAQEVDHG